MCITDTIVQYEYVFTIDHIATRCHIAIKDVAMFKQHTTQEQLV